MAAGFEAYISYGGSFMTLSRFWGLLFIRGESLLMHVRGLCSNTPKNDDNDYMDWGPQFKPFFQISSFTILSFSKSLAVLLSYTAFAIHCPYLLDLKLPGRLDVR